MSLTRPTALMSGIPGRLTMRNRTTTGSLTWMAEPEEEPVVRLTQEELDTVWQRVLTTSRRMGPELLVWSSRELSFVAAPDQEMGMLLVHRESTSISRDAASAAPVVIPQPEISVSKEGESEGGEEEGEGKGEEEGDGKGEGEGEEGKEEGKEEGEGEGEGGEKEKEEEEVPVVTPVERIVRDNFNFWKKPTQTPKKAFRDASTQAAEEDKLRLSGHVALAAMSDLYAADARAQRGEAPQEPERVAAEERMLLACRVLERMVVGNLGVQTALDFKDPDTPEDDEDGSGRLMELWKFPFEGVALPAITYLCWNPTFKNIFAIAFGNLEFSAEEQQGAVRLYTLANPTHPAYESYTRSGVVCVSFYETDPSFMAIGMNSGMVAVYRVGRRRMGLQYESPVHDKHSYPVQEIQWCKLEADGNKVLYSVSKDGQVCRWMIRDNALVMMQALIIFSATNRTVLAPDSVTIKVKAHIHTMVFYPMELDKFLIGTKEGYIYKCSTEYISKFLFILPAHDNLINKIEFNPFNPTVFITCSDDGLVKIWQDDRRECLFRFDVAGVCVGDVCWSPTNSTVFAAASDAAVRAFDVDADKHGAVCARTFGLQRAETLTRMAWNCFEPLIIVGSSQGVVRTAKTSPGLRKLPRMPKRGLRLEPRELEVKKLETILYYIIEPAALERPPDVAVGEQK
ncbi:dynein axonemal intermediate chain 1-like [Bacillus rossius redtenbacheri]|uniref:dynein axonemal intermediate chain 1-like n=1 Tax=Bacillus rossius redtenbacheri TaxID=93214 RepID=UPI002FDE3915